MSEPTAHSQIAMDPDAFSGLLYVQRRFSLVDGLQSGSQSTPDAGRRTLVTMKSWQHWRWREFNLNAKSSAGDFDVAMQSIDRPLIGHPFGFEGQILSEDEVIATISAQKSFASKGETRLLEVSSVTGRLAITCDRTTKRDFAAWESTDEWNVEFSERSLGELVSVQRAYGAIPCAKDAVGSFNEPARAAALDPLLAMCFLASMCIYFAFIESIYNTDISTGP